MEKIYGVLQRYVAKFRKQSSHGQYVNVPKDDQSTEDDCEFGGQACTADDDEKHPGEKVGTGSEGNTSENTEEKHDVDVKLKSSSLQAAWNISNLIQGICE